MHDGERFWLWRLVRGCNPPIMPRCEVVIETTIRDYYYSDGHPTKPVEPTWPTTLWSTTFSTIRLMQINCPFCTCPANICHSHWLGLRQLPHFRQHAFSKHFSVNENCFIFNVFNKRAKEKSHGAHESGTTIPNLSVIFSFLNYSPRTLNWQRSPIFLLKTVVLTLKVSHPDSWKYLGCINQYPNSQYF